MPTWTNRPTLHPAEAAVQRPGGVGGVLGTRRWPRYASKTAITIATTAPTLYNIAHPADSPFPLRGGATNIIAVSAGMLMARRQRTVANRPLENADAKPVKAPSKSPEPIENTKIGYAVGTSRNRTAMQAPTRAPSEAKPKTHFVVRFMAVGPASEALADTVPAKPEALPIFTNG